MTLFCTLCGAEGHSAAHCGWREITMNEEQKSAEREAFQGYINGCHNLGLEPSASDAFVWAWNRRAEQSAAEIERPPAIGQPWPAQGGIYAGIARGGNGTPDYHLIVSSHEQASQEEITWGAPGENEPTACSEWDGKANTFELAVSSHGHPAAQWAKDLKLAGFADWYLPARRELALCYATVPELFEKSDWYWSSTQHSPLTAWVQDFDGGIQNYGHKDGTDKARAVRRFPVNAPAERKEGSHE